MEKTEVNKLRIAPPRIRDIFNKDFIASAIVPLLLFYIFNYLKLTLVGIILSGCWCAIVFLVKWFRERKLNVLVLLAGIFSIMGLVGTIIFRNPAFYLVAPIAEDIVYALIFFASLGFPRSLIQVLVEDSGIVAFPEDFRNTPKYKSAWRIITIAWGLLNLSQALLRGVLLFTVPLALYYTISKIYGHISSPVLLILSYKFPQWYWKRKGVVDLLRQRNRNG